MMIRLTPAAPAQMNWRLRLGPWSSCFSARLQRRRHRGWSRVSSRAPKQATRPPGRLAACWDGAIGGVVGVFNGVLGVGQNGQSAQAPAANGAKQTDSAKNAKSTKTAKDTKGHEGYQNRRQGRSARSADAGWRTNPERRADRRNSDADIDRIKSELNLTPEQEKNWTAFNSAMHYLGHNGADRLNLRIARAQRDPPDDIIEQMRNEAQFLNDRAVDQRGVADAAEPLFTSLDDKQKAIFIQEMVRLSHERGLD